MVDKSKKEKKGMVDEEFVSSVLQKYPATTVLSLLHEISQMPRVKLDWDELVKKSATGITSAREYQMLWRHLAYHHLLVDKLDDCDEPLDDDSDLEFEVEAFPAVSSEASAEAAACVKVLIASGSSTDANGINGSTVEAPLTINIPTSKARASSENSDIANSNQGRNITVPVSVQKQTLPSVMSSENLDTNGTASSNVPPRRKRKPWTTEEDNELIAVVKKYGEGNWAIILKSEFQGGRTASQLSQRWAIIKRRLGNPREVSNCSVSEKVVATRHAMSLAIDMRMGDNLKSASSVNTGTNAHARSRNNSHSTATETSSSGIQTEARSQQDPTPGAAHRAGPSGSSTRVATKRPATKITLSPDSMVKAAAVAAGARIATPSDAASLLKAAQSKNAVHIMPGGGSLKKSSGPGNTTQVPSNVHFIRTVLSSHSTYSAAHPNASRIATTPLVQMKHAIPIQNNLEDAVLTSNSSSELEVKTVEEIANSSSDNARRGLQPSIEVNSKQVPVSSSSMQQVRADQAASSGYSLKRKADEDLSSVSEVKECVQEDWHRVTDGQVALPGSEDLVHLSCQTSAISGENGGKMLEDPNNDSELMDVDESKPEVKIENGSN